MHIFAASFWSEFYHALYPDHIYSHIPTPSLMSLDLILVALYVGIIAAAAVTCYKRGHMGKVVRAIIKNEALSPETAKTAEELGVGGSRTLTAALRKRSFGFTVRRADIDYKALFASSSMDKKSRRGGAVKGGSAADRAAAEVPDGTVITKNTGDIPFSAEEMAAARAAFLKKKFTPEEAAALRYYIPEEMKYSAEERFSRRGSDVRTVILWAVLLIPVFMVVRFFLPELLQMADNAIGMFVG